MRKATWIGPIGLAMVSALIVQAQDTPQTGGGNAMYDTPQSMPPTPAPPARLVFNKRLLDMARRMVEVQKTTPSDNIQAIIQKNHLEDTEALGKLDPDQSMAAIKRIAISLYQASSTKSDAVATQLMKEFQITYTPGPTAPQAGQK